MRCSLIALAAIVATVAASFASYPDHAELLRRQAPGTPQYDCHANCGGIITISRTENYCTNETFTTELDACLNCALEFGIWQYYNSSVVAAAEACGLEAVPVAANATSTEETTTTAAPTSSGTAGPASTSASATVASSGSAGAASGTSSSAAATSSFTGAANQLVIGAALALLPAGAVLADWL